MNCDHVFCLQCIKEFRKPKKYETEVAIYNKNCPTCKVFSDIIIPSFVFTVKKEDKDKMGDDYKQSMSKIECKYEKKDRKCPFSKECFYMHNLNFSEKENNKQVVPSQKEKAVAVDKFDKPNKRFNYIYYILEDLIHKRFFKYQISRELAKRIGKDKKNV